MGEFSDAVSITAISTKKTAPRFCRGAVFLVEYGKVIETKPGTPQRELFVGKGGTAERSYGNRSRFSTSSKADDDAPPSPPTLLWANTFFFSGGFAVKVLL